MKKIDLHTHTTASDGIYSSKELIDLAVRNDVTAMAITDHDTVDGLPEAVEYARSLKFKLYPGVEFSVDHEPGSFHLLGIDIDCRHEGLRSEVRRLAHHRETRAERIIDDLKKHGIAIPLEEVLAESDGGSIGRPHVARVMVNHGYAANIKDIFKKYLVAGKPGYVRKERVRLDVAISLIKDSGGIPVIAHPISLGFAGSGAFEAFLEDMMARGIEGIEAFAAMHTPEQAGEYLAIAASRNLIVTGGSDFHGDKDEIIGNYAKDRPIPIELYDKLEAYIRAGKK